MISQFKVYELVLNDIWKFDGSSWTWVSGTTDFESQPDGIFGIQGVASEQNYPSARYSPGLVQDSEKNIWLFGGRGRVQASGKTNFLNDLWTFNGTAWTWISGKDDKFGTIGASACSNYPRGRVGPAMWMDSNSVWVFGGLQDNNNGYGNDLWKFDGVYWIWVSGSSSLNNNGSYGTRGVASSQNQPPSRGFGMAYWTDSSNQFWLFGGYSTSLSTYLDDLWKFDGTNWIWVAGSPGTSQLPYGTIGYKSPFFTPGSRVQVSSFIDSKDHLYIYGGYTQGIEGGLQSDLWRWDGNSWAWISGKSQDIPNAPPVREGAFVSLDLSAQTLWLFGGSGARNDLWSTSINSPTATDTTNRGVTNVLRQSICGADVYYFTTGIDPFTTGKLTTQSVTSGEVTSAEVTSSPLTTIAFTTDLPPTARVSTGRIRLTSGRITSGAITSGILPVVTTDSPNNLESDSGGGPNLGAAIGASAVVAIVIVVAILVPLLILSYRRRKGQRNIDLSRDLELQQLNRDSLDSKGPEGEGEPKKSPTKPIESKPKNSVSEGKSPEARSKVQANSEVSLDIKHAIPYSEFELIKKVGKGFFGEVYQAKWKKETREVAFKQMSSAVGHQIFERFAIDSEALKKLKPHQNVITFLGVCAQPMALITEYASKGALSTILASNESLSDEVITKIIRGIVSGMQHLSREKVVHRVTEQVM